jgi:3-phosphoshikimate 1-carboxyvinyltransferase
VPIAWQGDDVMMNPAPRVGGTIRPPGSKSLTNRYLACLALANGKSVLREAGLCDDTDRMLAGLRALGLVVEVDAERRRVTVGGRNGVLPAEEGLIDGGLAGTATRFLTALTCLTQGVFTLNGAARMRERPIGPLVEVLRGLGARIGYAAAEGYLPLRIDGRGLIGGQVAFVGPPSSQYISAVLMVAPYAYQDVLLEVTGALPSRPYLEMTLDVMRELGVEVVDEAANKFIVPAAQRYRAGEYDVEPDASGATYHWAAAAVTGGKVVVRDLTRESRQGDVHFVDVLAQMGCAVEETAEGIAVTGPPVGELRAVDVDLNQMPDTVQTLAVVALFAQGTTHVRNVANLRIKETDRIAALERELSKLGARVEAREDGLSITPPERARGAAIDTYDDHRMAMSFAVAGMRIAGVTIRDAHCVSKSYPDYFADLARLEA